MQSMDALDLRSVFEIAAEALEGIGNLAKDVLNVPRHWSYTLTDTTREFSVSGKAGVKC